MLAILGWVASESGSQRRAQGGMGCGDGSHCPKEPWEAGLVTEGRRAGQWGSSVQAAKSVT